MFVPLGASAPQFMNMNSQPEVIEQDATVSTDDDYTYGFGDYLKGLFASQGAENMENRKYNAAQALMNREFQSEEAEKQRDWYETMSNSAYQRAVEDMRAAGINPILAYQQGGAASSGTGVAAGSAAAYTATGGDTLAGTIEAVAALIGSLKSSGSKTSDAIRLIKLVT